MEVRFRSVPYASENWIKAVKLREEVLRKPLGSKFTAKELKEEESHIHIIGLFQNKIVATAVLVPEDRNIKMQRVVVSAKSRNLSVGSKMMRYCEYYAQSLGYYLVYCHARNTAVNFYLQNGYSKEGNYFDEDGIPHLKMKKTL